MSSGIQFTRAEPQVLGVLFWYLFLILGLAPAVISPLCTRVPANPRPLPEHFNCPGNPDSSRTHAVCVLHCAGGGGGRLTLVDLAGSERAAERYSRCLLSQPLFAYKALNNTDTLHIKHRIIRNHKEFAYKALNNTVHP